MTRFYALMLVALSTSVALASSQYSYEKPNKPLDPGYTYQKPTNFGNDGHFFAALPTIKPLPAVPRLPALPTGRPKVTLTQQALYQSHPSSAPLGNTYIPPSGPPSSVGKIIQQYRPSSGFQQLSPPTLSPTSFGVTGSGVYTSPTPPANNREVILGTFGPPTGPNPTTPAQPLRIPFGKTAVIQFPGQSEQLQVQQAFGNAGGSRPQKQYAVIEIIDNDLMQNTEPFLPAPVRDDFRALFGASGTGASPPLNFGVQIDSRANANVFAQQQQILSNNQIALGSGGLGLVRLADGKLHLGSGSLGYISNEMIRQNAQEARTRSEVARAGALHFGHGSLAQSPIGGATTFPRRY